MIDYKKFLDDFNESFRNILDRVTKALHMDRILALDENRPRSKKKIFHKKMANKEQKK